MREAEPDAAQVYDLIDDPLIGPLTWLLSVRPPHAAEGAMFRASANGLDGRPHVFGRVQQVPAGNLHLTGINPAALIHALCSASRMIA